MSPKLKTVLTAMCVVVLTAIYVVGIFLLWDVFDFERSLDKLINTDLYATDYTPGSKTTTEVTFDGKALAAEEEQLIKEFFVFRFAGLGALKTEKMARLYTVQTNSELFDGLAYDYDVLLAGKCPLDLSFGECSLTVDVRRRHAVPKTNKIEIDLKLSGTMNCRGPGRPAVIRGEKHSFVLLKDEKKINIEQHTTDRPSAYFADCGLDKVLASNGYLRSDLNYTFFPKYTAPALELLDEQISGISFDPPQRSSYPTAEYEYDRETAANSAINGFSTSGAFTDYDENDANFLSRCIFESGIPMDSQGDRYDQWKWYDDEVNTERKKTGCSKSWYDREAFYRYVRDNEGFGMVACITTTGGGEIGDIIQLMHNGECVGEYMITGIMAAPDGSVKDYLVSNDKYASTSFITLGCTDFRVLHIVGYNTANI